MFPLIDELDKIRIVGEDYNPDQHKVVAMLTTSVYWRDVIKGILPPGSHGTVVVFENPCNPSFTYQIE
jgi:hypothetical protein